MKPKFDDAGWICTCCCTGWVLVGILEKISKSGSLTGATYFVSTYGYGTGVGAELPIKLNWDYYYATGGWMVGG